MRLDKCERMVAIDARGRRLGWLNHQLTHGVPHPRGEEWRREFDRLLGSDAEPVTLEMIGRRSEHAYHTNAYVRAAVVRYRHELKWASTLADVLKAWEGRE